MSIRIPTWVFVSLFLILSSCSAQTNTEVEKTDLGLEKKFQQALLSKGKDYKPRTHHFNQDGSAKFVNRLIFESSPYLLQHAHNPVNWYPWGDEAFTKAKKENKPVLLSIGYSTCHWCHVMEEESFEDLEIATFLNQNYVAIKVDREQRPDVDAVYMQAVQMMTGGGGWPMTTWLTPNRQVFYGGTYFPARDGDRGTGMGFLTILKRLAEIYQKEPSKVISQAKSLTEAIKKSSESSVSSGKMPGADVFQAATSYLKITFDKENGGFDGRQKFPRSVNLEFLLRQYHRTKDPEILQMVTRTLEAMMNGGIHDHVGGGFHRYATDREWLVPHFEKMLYDNALLAISYLEAYQITGREDFAKIVREILRYIEKEMTSPDGGFFSATDADSEGVEGKFFVWTPQEIVNVLGEKNGNIFNAVFGVTQKGNLDGKNILHIAKPMKELAKTFNLSEASLEASIEKSRELLYEERKKRTPPLKDTKILTSWNGLMISAFARASQVFGDDGYRRTAENAANFFMTNMKSGDQLYRSYAGGHAFFDGTLDDYAFLVEGLLNLFESSFDPRWIEESIKLQAVLRNHFYDEKEGGFFQTSDAGEKLLIRLKSSYDGAEPSGNSVEILNLLRLYTFTDNDLYRKMSEKSLKAFSKTLVDQSMSVPRMLVALDFYLDRPKEILIVKSSKEVSAQLFLSKIGKTFLPNKIIAVTVSGEDQRRLEGLIPLFKEKTATEGRLTAYVCEGQICKLPTSSLEIFSKLITEQPQSSKQGEIK